MYSVEFGEGWPPVAFEPRAGRVRPTAAAADEAAPAIALATSAAADVAVVPVAVVIG
jgi:hypothetical protein